MLRITYPLPYQVIQRGPDNTARAEIRGICDTSAEAIHVRFVPCADGQGTETPWYRIPHWMGSFGGFVPAPAGWLRIEVRQMTGGRPTDYAFQGCFGVGEVFMIFGHSIAQGGAPHTRGATDWRVSCIDYYEDTLTDEAALPFTFKPLADHCKIGPFSTAPYAWAKLGDRLAKRLNLPILFFNCAHGGSNIEQAYNSIMRIPFNHLFVRFYTGMPYRPLALTLRNYVPRTGVRAVLCQHGINDPVDEAAFYERMRTVIQYTRQTFNVPELGWMLMHESKPGVEGFEGIQRAIKRIWNDEPRVYPGPDFTRVTDTTQGREDSIHLQTEADLELYAQIWDEALTDDFFRKCLPIAPGLTLPTATPV